TRSKRDWSSDVCSSDLPPAPMLPRLLALTIPAVTVEVKLNGLPTANTHSPTFNFSESPKGIVGKSVASILIKAISVVGSAPIIRSEERRVGKQRNREYE